MMINLQIRPVLLLCCHFGLDVPFTADISPYFILKVSDYGAQNSGLKS